MADFCHQCTDELAGCGKINDLRGITQLEEELQGLYAMVLCEGCGPIQVDSEGRCISEDCYKKHREQKERKRKMTDRLKGCTVAFERDIREDDAEVILNAIKAIRGVENVTVNVKNPDDWINRQRIKNALRKSIWALLDEIDRVAM